MTTTSPVCHPEAAEFSASPRTPNEGPMQLAAYAIRWRQRETLNFRSVDT
jgi:hypothetical protein